MVDHASVNTGSVAEVRRTDPPAMDPCFGVYAHKYAVTTVMDTRRGTRTREPTSGVLNPAPGARGRGVPAHTRCPEP